jgi:hypothetical protein
LAQAVFDRAPAFQLSFDNHPLHAASLQTA